MSRCDISCGKLQKQNHTTLHIADRACGVHQCITCDKQLLIQISKPTDFHQKLTRPSVSGDISTARKSIRAQIIRLRNTNAADPQLQLSWQNPVRSSIIGHKHWTPNLNQRLKLEISAGDKPP